MNFNKRQNKAETKNNNYEAVINGDWFQYGKSLLILDYSTLSHLCYVTSSTREDCVDGGDAICRSLNLDEVVRLHQSRRCHQEGRVCDTPEKQIKI